ncbi:hypothetical protein B0H13DRAFT_1882243 [Mycena leptocephala]|nr:hypothetical protein B0H13DRAFT_1882243 [Mycena leptocephala]
MWGSSSPLASVSRRLRVNHRSTFIARGPPTPAKTPIVFMGQSLAKHNPWPIYCLLSSGFSQRFRIFVTGAEPVCWITRSFLVRHMSRVVPESPHFVALPAIIWPMTQGPGFLFGQVPHTGSNCQYVLHGLVDSASCALPSLLAARKNLMLREMSLTKVDRQILRAGGNPPFASAAAAFAYAIFV